MLPDEAEPLSLTSLGERLREGRQPRSLDRLRHDRGCHPRTLFAEMLRLTNGLLPAPLPPLRASIQEHLGLPAEQVRLVSTEVCPPITRSATHRPISSKIKQQTEEIAMQRANQDLNRLRQANVLPFSASGRWYSGNLG